MGKDVHFDQQVWFKSGNKLLDGREELLDGREELLDGREEFLDDREELLDDREELLDDREELLDGREELLEGRNNHFRVNGLKLGFQTFYFDKKYVFIHYKNKRYRSCANDDLSSGFCFYYLIKFILSNNKKYSYQNKKYTYKNRNAILKSR